MSTNPLAQPRRSLMGVVLCIVLAAACDLTPSGTSPFPSPAPRPEATQYHVSGTVTDAADGGPIASATVQLRYGEGHLITRTNADGSYAFSFRTSRAYFPPSEVVPAGHFLALLAAGDGADLGDTSRGHWTTVQLVSWGTQEVVQNVRLRPVRTLAAGQSMGVSVDPDSSLAWDKEWDPWQFTSFTTLEEEFLVSVQTDGVLTIDVRPETGGNVATLTCSYVGCQGARVQGTVSIPVEAGRSPFYFSVQSPRASAPQRYEIRTSLR